MQSSKFFTKNRKRSGQKLNWYISTKHIFELKIFKIKKETKNDILNIHYNEQSKFSTSENNKKFAFDKCSN